MKTVPRRQKPCALRPLLPCPVSLFALPGLDDAGRCSFSPASYQTGAAHEMTAAAWYLSGLPSATTLPWSLGGRCRGLSREVVEASPLSFRLLFPGQHLMAGVSRETMTDIHVSICLYVNT